jgi:hypothetical protein
LDGSGLPNVQQPSIRKSIIANTVRFFIFVADKILTIDYRVFVACIKLVKLLFCVPKAFKMKIPHFLGIMWPPPHISALQLWLKIHGPLPG